MTIEDEMTTLVLMGSLPPSWETFVTTMCNASRTTVSYSDAKSSILTEDAQRRSFVHDLAKDTFVVQSSDDWTNNRGRSSYRQLIDAQSRSKSRDNWTCNYYKKPRHIKAKCCALKEENEKAQRADRKGSRQEEVHFVGSSTELFDWRPEYTAYWELSWIGSSAYNWRGNDLASWFGHVISCDSSQVAISVVLGLCWHSDSVYVGNS